MPHISIILKRSPACKFITLLERTDAERSMSLKSMLSISASLYEKKKIYINSKQRNDFFKCLQMYRSSFGNRKITNLYFTKIVFFFHLTPLDVIQTSRHTRHCTLSIARARHLSLAYIVCYNVDSCITVVFGSLLAF